MGQLSNMVNETTNPVEIRRLWNEHKNSANKWDGFQAIASNKITPDDVLDELIEKMSGGPSAGMILFGDALSSSLIQARKQKIANLALMNKMNRMKR